MEKAMKKILWGGEGPWYIGAFSERGTAGKSKEKKMRKLVERGLGEDFKI